MFHVRDKELVVPGQLIAESVHHGQNCFHEGRKVFSSTRGLSRIYKNKIDVIPSSGSYVPNDEDIVIGVVTEILQGMWLVNISQSYDCILRGEEVAKDTKNKDLREYFNVGDILSARVHGVDEVKSSILIRPMKLEGGFIVDINPQRVPRVIGRNRSMLNLMREKTGCRIVVGMNGRVWICGEKTNSAIKAIKKIEREAQTRGLTERITKMLGEVKIKE